MTTEANNPDTIEEPTPPEGEKPGATPTDADKSAPTQPAADKSEQYDPDTVEKIVKKRLDRERKKWEQEREEAEERARMSEAEKLRKDLEAKDAEVAEWREKATAAERIAALHGQVRDPKAALKLLEDDHINEDGSIDIDAFLEAYPFLAPETDRPTAKSATAPTPATGAPAKNPFAKDTLNLTEQARLLRENPKLAAQLKAAAE